MLAVGVRIFICIYMIVDKNFFICTLAVGLLVKFYRLVLNF